MDEKTAQQILKRMEGKSTSELSQILSENDHSEYVDEVFEAIKQILMKRNETKGKINEFEKKKDFSALLEIIKSSDLLSTSEDERNGATDVLTRIADSQTLEDLAMDTSLYTPTRLRAIAGLREIGSSRSLNRLVSLLNDPDKTVRSGAVEAINKIDASALQLTRCQSCNEFFPQGISQELKLCPECGSAIAAPIKELIPIAKTAPLIRSIIVGVVVGILADLILIAIGISLHIWALSRGGNPFLKFAPGYKERGAAILGATFFVFSFSAATLLYNRLLKESGKMSNSFLAYPISSIITFVSIMVLLPTRGKLADAAFFAVSMALCLPGVALVLLGKIEKLLLPRR